VPDETRPDGPCHWAVFLRPLDSIGSVAIFAPIIYAAFDLLTKRFKVQQIIFRLLPYLVIAVIGIALIPLSGAS